jgi:hypothetical protein
LQGRKLELEVRRDVFVSVVQVLRTAHRHKAELIIADGQAGAVGLAFCKPLVVETALAARVVQQEEVMQLAAAWNRLELVMCRGPRLGRARAGLDLLVKAIPELVADYPVDGLRSFVVLDSAGGQRKEIEDWAGQYGLAMLKSLADHDWAAQAWSSRTPLWEHHGTCSCGRKSYLFSECSECIRKGTLTRSPKKGKFKSSS